MCVDHTGSVQRAGKLEGGVEEVGLGLLVMSSDGGWDSCQECGTGLSECARLERGRMDFTGPCGDQLGTVSRF